MTEDGKKTIAVTKKAQNILESIDDGFWILDRDWHCTYINERQAQLLGIAPENILGKNVWKLLPDLVGSNLYLQFHRVLADQVSTRFEYFCPSQQRWFEYRAYALVNGVCAIALDITKYKQIEAKLQQTHYQLEQQTIELETTNQELEQTLEELRVTEEELRVQNEELLKAYQITQVERQRYQDLFEFAPDGYAVTDVEGIIREANRAIATLLIIESGCLINTPLSIYISHRNRQAFRDLLTQLQQQPQPQIIELNLRSNNRAPFSTAITVSPIKNELKELIGLRWLIRDISKRKQEERCKEAQYKVTRVLSEATTFADATPAILQSLCESLEWQLGVIWSVDDRHNFLRYINSWQAPSVNLQKFIEVNQQATFALGAGFPGRIWQSRKPLWISNLGKNNQFLRAAAAVKEKLCAVLGFPIVLGDKVLGVIECFRTHPQQADADLLAMMETIGSQIGQFMERKRTEESLRQSQKLFQKFMDNSPATAFIKDKAGRYIYVNALIEQLFNRNRAEWIGKTDFDFFPQENAQEFRHNDLTVLNEKKVISILETAQLEDGEHHYMSFKFPLRDVSGEILVAGMAIDISDRLRAEEALKQQEQRYRYIFESVGVAICEEDFSPVKTAIDELKRQGIRDFRQYFAEHPDFVQQAISIVRVVDVNRATVQMFEAKDKHELLTSVSQLFLPETLKIFIEELISIAEEKTYFEAETVLQTLQGKHLNVIFTISFPPTSESFDSVLVSIINITERIQAEEALRLSDERFRLAARAVNGIVYDWDIKTDTVYRSEGLYQLIGIHPEDVPPTNDWWSQRMHPDDLDRIQPTLNSFISSKEHDRYEFEYRIHHQDGRWIEVWDRGYLIRDRHGQLIRVVGSTSDISDRKRAETEKQQLLEQIKTERELLEAVVQQMPAGVIVAEAPSGKLILKNEQVEHIWRGAFVLAENIEQYQKYCGFYADGRLYAPHEWPLSRSVTTGEVVKEEEILFLRGDGSRGVMLVSSTPILDEYGKIKAGVVTFYDISERKQMELAIRKSETVLQAFLASSPIAMAFLDPELRYMYANEALAKTNGIPLNEHLGRTVWEVLPTWAPYIQDIINNVMETKEPLLNQEIYGETNPPEVYRHGLVNYYPVCLADGEVLGVGISSMDITELKQTEQALRESEAKYRSLVMASSQIVWRANRQGQFIEVQGWEEFTGQSVEELLAGSKKAIHPDDLAKIKQEWWHAVVTKSPYEIEHRIRKYDGTYEYFSVRGIPMLDDEGEVYAWVGMTTNINERKQVEIERERLLEKERRVREEAEAANRIKDEFLAVLSHELRTPLNPILGWVQLLQRGDYDQQTTQRALSIIERNAKLQTQLIEDLLDVSRILRGKMVLNVDSVNLVAVIESALETVQLAAEAKKIEIHKILAADLKCISGDSARLQQVVWNLLSNAVKFTPQGGRIEVRLESYEFSVMSSQLKENSSTQNSLKNSQSFAQITVTDTGKGIHPDFLPHVFECFRQEDGKITRKFGGLGLGLAIVRHLVELHGGTVKVESPGEGLGATFSVRLPLIEISSEKCQDNELAIDFDLNYLRILVVDDEADMRELAIAILQQYNAEIKVAASVVEALTIFDQFKPDLLISDIGMPNLDGYELMRQVRQLPDERGGNIPAIAVTAYAAESDQKQALQAGFQSHITKPIKPSELVKTIAFLVGRSFL